AFITGLAGRELKLEASKKTYTDNDTLYLPAQLNRYNDPDKNYRLYKAKAVNLWAQTWFGTFRRRTSDSPHLIELLEEFEDNGRALRLFNLLETIRLNACIERELPGLAREMLTLDAPAPVHDETWKWQIQKLEQADASVEDTLQATAELYPLEMPWPDPLLYQGEFDLDAASDAIEQRLQADKDQLRNALEEIIREMSQKSDASNDDGQPNQGGDQPDIEFDGDDLKIDGESVQNSDDLQEILDSLLQDLDRIPDDWLTDLSDDSADGGSSDAPSQQNRPVGSNLDNAFFYDEWDFRRQTYRRDWCVLNELDTHPIYDDFRDATLEKYLHLVADIRKHFEALRGEDKVLRAQPVGDNIDLDALITAYADMLNGVEMTDRLFSQMHKVDRDLAVIFMVDVSGSTKGWINDAERESLILLCEALEILGDQYAIYGFSGMTRNRCEIYRIKKFEQSYDRDVRARISGLRPQDYTRMGVTIRHLSTILNRVEAKTRILITLSDGKPDDYDGYRGDYGIEDTRQALMEARHSGIHPFCITIDKEASEYLPHMYGHASYVVIDEVRKLPLKVAEIYRKLTT
ncbi:MAG: VWA domain-containing protein, partial [Pseudomonadota bacterium]